MVEDADRIRQIEGVSAKRQRENIRLDEMNVVALADVAVRGINGGRQVHAEHLRTFRGRLLGKSSGTHAGIEQ